MKSMTLALLAILAAATPALAQPTPPNAAATQPSPAEAAWSRYRDALQQERQRLLASEFAKDPALRAKGLFYLQSLEAIAFNLYVAPRTGYPALYTQSVFMPFEISWGMPNPDFFYHNGFIDGAHTYRIYGNRKGEFWSTLQVMHGMWGDADQKTIANVDFDDVPTRPNGDFEIFLGPNPPAKPNGQYWVKTDPEFHNTALTLRDVTNDWSRDRTMDVHIEILDRAPDEALNLSGADLAEKIDKATTYVRANVDYVLGHLEPKPGQPPVVRNQFVSPKGSVAIGGNPLACYGMILYDIQPDEALVIDMPTSPARYSGVQLGSIWSQTTDYSYHQSSLNPTQAKPDSDGRLREVLSLTDPGVPNWLDPVGDRQGFVGFRWYKGPGCVTPTVTKIKLAELRNVLPKDTPVVTPDQRRAALDRRRADSLRRYGQ